MAKKKKRATKKRAAKTKSKPKTKRVTKKPLSKKKLKGGKLRRGTGRRGQRYSTKQQTRLLDKYHELRKAGNNAQKASKKVGVSYLTLLKWEKKTGKRIKTKRGRPKGISKKSALKRALKVSKGKKKAAKPSSGLTLVTPSGFRIEGITSAELIKVLRGL